MPTIQSVISDEVAADLAAFATRRSHSRSKAAAILLKEALAFRARKEKLKNKWRGAHSAANKERRATAATARDDSKPEHARELAAIDAGIALQTMAHYAGRLTALERLPGGSDE